jgi:hypothetical protein
VRETGAGEVVAPDDVDGIVDALRRVSERSLYYSPHGVEGAYTYPVAAQTLSEQIEVAIARRSRGAA